MNDNLEEKKEEMLTEGTAPIKFASMDPNLIFAGLTREAKMFLWQEADFRDAGPELQEKVGKNAYLLALSGEDNLLKYVLAMVNGKSIVARPVARILEKGSDKLILFLLGFPLKDGKEAVMVKQGETESGLLCIALEVDGEVKFEWTEEEVKSVLDQIKKDEEPEKPEWPDEPELVEESETK